MKVAVINEVSARARNTEIVAVLKKAGHTIYNVGMVEGDVDTELTYIHTGLMAGIIANLGIVDCIVGGCGTGQGFMLSAMQYPNIFCGLIIDPLDAWLFSQINGGNCVSLALNKGYGWAADINLEYIFDKLFIDPSGQGYPLHRQESQKSSRLKLQEISANSHKDFIQIIKDIDQNIVKAVFNYKPFRELVSGAVKNTKLQKEIIELYL